MSTNPSVSLNEVNMPVFTDRVKIFTRNQYFIRHRLQQVNSWRIAGLVKLNALISEPGFVIRG